MSVAVLLWKNLFRRRTRSLFTFLSIVVAFVLFGFLAAIRVAFTLGVDIAGADRLLIIHKVSFIQPLPVSYGGRVAALEGVEALTHANWFGGIYQEPRNFFAQMAVDAETFLDLYPEYVLPEDQKRAWLADRTGAIAGRALAERFGWRVGDRIPLRGTIFRPPGGETWEFTLDGIYDGARQGVDTTQFFFHYEYLNQAMGGDLGLIGWYIIRIADPDRAVETASRIDGMFANSPFETKTSTEKAFVQAFASQIGDIGTILTAVLVAVFFTILLVTANTMAQSIRERTNELALLKTIGFTNGQILVLVLAESCLLAGAGGALGLGAAWLLIRQGDPTGGLLPAFYFPPADMAAGALLVVLLGLAAGLFPALSATRLRIVEALRRT